MRILVLGSSGVIGSAVSLHLKSIGHEVTDWDISLSPEHDLRVRGSLDNVLKNIEFVIFLAFDVGGSKYYINTAEYISNNVKLMEYTFESLSKFKLPFIHATSQMSNMDNPYGALKRLGEFYTHYLEGINVKIWNVYGPEEVGAKSHVIPDFINQAITTKKINMMTNGKEERQFLHGRDFATAIVKLMDSYKKYSGLTIDISSFEWVSILDVANIIADVCGPGVEVIPGKAESSFQTRVNQPLSDIRKTGWKPSITLYEGITLLCQSKDV
jgi:nucleoside-diphosphate-sugar epimerase